MKNLFVNSVAVVTFVLVGGCKTQPESDTRISADQWPSISGNYATRAQELGVKFELPTETAPVPVSTPIKISKVRPEPVIPRKPVAIKASRANTTSAAARAFGSVLVAGSDEITFPISFKMARKAIASAQANRETFAFGGYNVVAGRASLFDPKGAKRDFIVFYKQPSQEQVVGPRIDTEVLPFIRQATGCNVSPKIGERDMQTLPMGSTVVFPIHCGKV